MSYLTHHLSAADISIFQRKSATFAISRNTDKDCILNSNYYHFFEFFKIVLKNMVTILIILKKMATLGLLKTKVY